MPALDEGDVRSAWILPGAWGGGGARRGRLSSSCCFSWRWGWWRGCGSRGLPRKALDWGLTRGGLRNWGRILGGGGGGGGAHGGGAVLGFFGMRGGGGGVGGALAPLGLEPETAGNAGLCKPLGTGGGGGGGCGAGFPRAPFRGGGGGGGEGALVAGFTILAPCAVHTDKGWTWLKTFR